MADDDEDFVEAAEDLGTRVTVDVFLFLVGLKRPIMKGLFSGKSFLSGWPKGRGGSVSGS